MTTATRFTLADVTAAIEAVVEEKGSDYVYDQRDEYEGCVYVNADGTPSCIVGRVMHRLYGDEALDKLSRIEGTTPRTGAFLAIFPDLTDDISMALYMAQVEQDNEKTWGEALAAYKREINK